jgi:hypothetical protein
MVTGPLAREPMPRNTERQGKRNELGLVIAYRGGPLVPSPGVAHPEKGRAGLNESILLGPGQNGETQRGKTVNGAGVIHPHPDPHPST